MGVGLWRAPRPQEFGPHRPRDAAHLLAGVAIFSSRRMSGVRLRRPFAFRWPPNPSAASTMALSAVAARLRSNRKNRVFSSGLRLLRGFRRRSFASALTNKNSQPSPFDGDASIEGGRGPSSCGLSLKRTSWLQNLQTKNPTTCTLMATGLRNRRPATNVAHSTSIAWPKCSGWTATS